MPMVTSAKGKRFLDMYSRTKQFRALIPQIEKNAAAEATTVSRATFRRLEGHRPIAPTRAGRPSTEGHFASDILWEVIANKKLGNVELDINRLPPYVFIQEIGTGQTARILNPVGTISVRSQYGRAISANLFWASGPGGAVSPARTGGRDEQLYYASELNAQSVANSRRRKKRIRREIKGKHFIADGGRAGFVQLERALTDEAKRIFR